jgi:hypothetical protein
VNNQPIYLPDFNKLSEFGWTTLVTSYPSTSYVSTVALGTAIEYRLNYKNTYATEWNDYQYSIIVIESDPVVSSISQIPTSGGVVTINGFHFGFEARSLQVTIGNATCFNPQFIVLDKQIR